MGKHDWADKRVLQVWAWDSVDARLVRIRDGHADELREACTAGRLVCPMPDCDDPRFEPHIDHTRAGAHVPAVFHHVNATDAHDPERWHHFIGKLLIQAWLQRRGWHAEIERWVPEPKRRPDVTAIDSDGTSYGIEVQYCEITRELWERRSADMAAAGLHAVWLWGHRGDQFRPDRHAEDAVRLSDLQTDAWAAGTRPHWLDPDTGTIISLHPEEQPPRWSPPRYVIEPLSDCSIEGGAFITPADRAAAELERARVARLEAERRLEEARVARIKEMLEEKERRRLEHEALSEQQRAARGQYRDQRRLEEAEAWQRAAQRQELVDTYGEVPKVLRESTNREHNVYRHPEAWRAEVFFDLVQGHVGDTFPFNKFLRRLLGGRESVDQLCDAVRGFLWVLREAGFVDFASTGWRITSDIDVIADLDTAPPPDHRRTGARLATWQRPMHQFGGYAVTDEGTFIRNRIAQLEPGDSVTTSELMVAAGLPLDDEARRAVINLLIDLKFAGELAVANSIDLFEDGPIRKPGVAFSS